MATYLETIHCHCEQLTETKATAQWTERLTPLKERLAKLLATIPTEIKSKGISLPAIRTMLVGKWRGKCHLGELGTALRPLGYERRRNWGAGRRSFAPLWYLNHK
jgi:hypothetical protein